MTKRELINRLSGMSDDALVFVSSYVLDGDSTDDLRLHEIQNVQEGNVPLALPSNSITIEIQR
jgi:hypothetical protein